VPGIDVSGSRLEFAAVDKTSPIAACRYSVNAGPWQPLVPVDGLFDSSTERFSADVRLEPGENSVAVWASDASGNSGTTQLLVRR
jgi:hypothetical protein